MWDYTPGRILYFVNVSPTYAEKENMFRVKHIIRLERMAHVCETIRFGNAISISFNVHVSVCLVILVFPMRRFGFFIK